MCANEARPARDLGDSRAMVGEFGGGPIGTDHLYDTIPYLRQHVKALENHNRLLIQAATESARKLQENTRLLTSAATESARRLQEREAE